MDNEVQPDALLRIADDIEGQSQISADGYLEGPPELVVEIAASSAAYDLYDKLQVYRRNGVQEYVVWSMYPKRLEWFRLHEGSYLAVTPGDDGIIRSTMFPGQQLHIEATNAQAAPHVLAVLQDGIALPEHAAFVVHLAERASHSGG